MHQCPDALSVLRQIGQNHRAGGIVVPVVVRRELIRPHQSSVLRLARQHAGAPLVVSESLLRVIGRGVARAVIDEIELRIVGDRSPQDRKSTRLNSSHEWISYAVFCLKKKKTQQYKNKKSNYNKNT